MYWQTCVWLFMFIVLLLVSAVAAVCQWLFEDYGIVVFAGVILLSVVGMAAYALTD